MFYLKGKRFGFPLIQRYGILKHITSHPISTNRHPGLEIHYVLKGEIAWEIEGTASPLRVTGGNLGIIPAATSHRAIDGSGTPADRIGIIFDSKPSHCTEGTPFSADELARIFARISSCGGKSHRLTSRMTAILRELPECMSLESAKEPERQLQLRILSTDLIYETYRSLGEPEVLATGHDVIPKIREWIDQHLSESISVERLVALSGYGRSRFFTLFISDTGLSPNDYILRRRISCAKKILSSRKNPSMTELAMRCGFASSSAFSKSFRKIIGMSPREFVSARSA